MKDYILLLLLLVSGINMVVADQVSDFLKCVHFLSLLVTTIAWLRYSKQGQRLVEVMENLVEGYE